jgi:predicted GNAT superfamily acetyltransferase
MPVRVVELTQATQHHALAGLFAQVWATEIMHPSTMTALTLAGGYVVGAYEGDELMGGSVGFLGVGHLHSDVTGVDPAAQSKGIGYALKQHQRGWCAKRGIPQVRWTFDPLVARNAYFNLHRLGARAVAYLPNCYGPLTDGINIGDASDRLYVHWDVSDVDTRVAESPDADALRHTGAAVVLDRIGDEPVPRPAGPDRVRLVAVPTDIEGLRRRDPGLAARWRRAVGEALPAALGAGYRIAGISRDGFYALRTSL